MALLSIGDALNGFLKNAHWKTKINEIRLQNEWKEIMGATIAKYTSKVTIKEGTLTIYTEVAALKQELQFGKPQIIANINEYFKETIVKEVVIR